MAVLYNKAVIITSEVKARHNASDNAYQPLSEMEQEFK